MGCNPKVQYQTIACFPDYFKSIAAIHASEFLRMLLGIVDNRIVGCNSIFLAGSPPRAAVSRGFVSAVMPCGVQCYNQYS